MRKIENNQRLRNSGRFSVRTLLLAMMGVGLLCATLTAGGPAIMIHTLLVLAFAIPGGSYGHDRYGTSRGVAFATCVAAVAGSFVLVAVVLTSDWLRLAS